ncbi:alpha/beta-hydrolase [Tothia fuscella]|uniref:Alpha/beta-hydrolase n=1 Tax=Tothia fuscella TaxID=1048955 RepID=A0A9P4NYH3_9PEZI|nr:alpha/beta-hydrolase [Tothia fuscella]
MRSFNLRMVVNAALAGTCLASPLAPVAIPLIDFQNINLYSQYAAAAYCNANNNGTLNPSTTLTCAGTGSQSNCPLVEGSRCSNDTENSRSIFSSPTYGTACFVAVDDTNKRIVVSFRGTDARRYPKTALPNIFSVGVQNPVPQYCAGCAAAKGYSEAFGEVNTTVINAVIALRRDANRSGYQVVTTGHSLGGAVSTFAALELRRMGIPVHAASFGMPRTANPQLADFISAQDANPNPNVNPQQRNYRVIHRGDFIPDSLPLSILGRESRHITPSFNITTDNTAVPGANDITIVTINGTSQQTGVTDSQNIYQVAHAFYLGPISKCN